MTKKVADKIQKIIWEDHFSTNGRWMDVDDVKKEPIHNISVGKVIYEDRKAVILAASWSPHNGLVNDPVYILKGCIVSRKDVR